MAKEIESGTTVTVTVRTRSFFSTFAGRCFIGFLIPFEVFLVASTILMGVWMGVYRAGYDWNGTPEQQFSYHPLFMFIGLIFLYGNGMLVYRLCRSCSKLPLKIVHSVIQAASLIFAAVGLAAAFNSHNRKQIRNMYSMHSWLGLIVVILFGIQWLVGFLTFLLPFASQKFREFVRPIHHYFGAMLFIFSIATAYTGMSQLLVHHLGASYMHFPPEGVFANCLTLFMGLIVFFGIFLVANIDFRRLPAYIDEMR